MFASDYPHPEGTRDPIRKFEASVTECDQKTMDAFYHGNTAELMGLSLVSSTKTSASAVNFLKASR